MLEHVLASVQIRVQKHAHHVVKNVQVGVLDVHPIAQPRVSKHVRVHVVKHASPNAVLHAMINVKVNAERLVRVIAVIINVKRHVDQMYVKMTVR